MLLTALSTVPYAVGERYLPWLSSADSAHDSPPYPDLQRRGYIPREDRLLHGQLPRHVPRLGRVLAPRLAPRDP